MVSARLAKVFLIVIWMAVAPIPVVVLVFVILFVVRAITFVALAQVTAVGAVFTVIPVVVERPAVSQRPRWIRLPQAQSSGIERLHIDVSGSWLVLQTAIHESEN
jgi:hypothetical protein